MTSEQPERDPSDSPPVDPSSPEPAGHPTAERPPEPTGPVSGHVVPSRASGSPLEAPEHHWEAARARVFPLLHPPGTTGVPVAWLLERPALGGPVSHTQPIVAVGPAGLAIVYAIAASGFDVIVNGDHLLSWGIGAAALDEAARANLTGWSGSTGWTDETSGTRRLLSSDSGEGYDAARILLPEVRQYLVRELSSDETAGSRILVGLPERHLLVAGTLRPDDPEFVELFREFVVDHSAAAEEPIDDRVFELVGGELRPFATEAAA